MMDDPVSRAPMAIEWGDIDAVEKFKRYATLRAQLAEARELLGSALSSLDRLMGDTDPNDETDANVVACQSICAFLSRMGGAK